MKTSFKIYRLPPTPIISSRFCWRLFWNEVYTFWTNHWVTIALVFENFIKLPEKPTNDEKLEGLVKKRNDLPPTYQLIQKIRMEVIDHKHKLPSMVAESESFRLPPRESGHLHAPIAAGILNEIGMELRKNEINTCDPVLNICGTLFLFWDPRLTTENSSFWTMLVRNPRKSFMPRY